MGSPLSRLPSRSTRVRMAPYPPTKSSRDTREAGRRPVFQWIALVPIGALGALGALRRGRGRFPNTHAFTALLVSADLPDAGRYDRQEVGGAVRVGVAMLGAHTRGREGGRPRAFKGVDGLRSAPGD